MNERTMAIRLSDQGTAGPRPRGGAWRHLWRALQRQLQRLQWGPPVEAPRD